MGLPNFHYLLDLDLQYNGLLKAKFSLFSLFARFRFAVQRTLKSQIFPKGRLSYHLCVKYFSQLSFNSEMYTKSTYENGLDSKFINFNAEAWSHEVLSPYQPHGKFVSRKYLALKALLIEQHPTFDSNIRNSFYVLVDLFLLHLKDSQNCSYFL